MARKRTYQSALRESLADATRDRIVDAAHRRLKTTRPVDLSYADVAAEAGVSVRTVYRCFPQPDDLFLAVSKKLLARVFEGDRQPETLDELYDSLGRWFGMLDEDPALFRVVFAVPTRSRIDQPNMFARFFGAYIEHLRPADRPAAYALIDLLGSPYAWDVMHHNWGVSSDRARRAVIFAIRALLDHIQREPEVFAARTPAPPPPIRRPR